MGKTPPTGFNTDRMMPVFYLFCAPLFSLGSRFRKGEGALLGLTVFLDWLYPSAVPTVYTAFLAAAGLAVMYGLNDIHDAPTDLYDPGRVATWVRTLAERQGYAYLLNGAYSLILLWFAWRISVDHLFAVSAALVLSAVYNLAAKGRPGLDLLIVFLWGPAFIHAYCPTAPFRLALAAGFMLAMNHAFQMYRDRSTDAAAGISTTAVYSPRLQSASYYVATAGTAVAFLTDGFVWAAVMATAGVCVVGFGGFSRQAWLTLKVTQVIAWLCTLLPRIFLF